MTSVTIRDHFRPIDGEYPDGIYRVVGTNAKTVTLLHVGDADGRRINTGHVITVTDDELERFTSAPNPDGSRPLGAAIASQLEMLSWSARAFGQQLRAQPVPAAFAATLVLAGYVGEWIGTVPDIVTSALILVGALGLAYIGSGRLQR